MDSFFDLRYPIWNSKEIKIINSKFSENCRAPIWYSKNIEFDQVKINGVKEYPYSDINNGQMVEGER